MPIKVRSKMLAKEKLPLVRDKKGKDRYVPNTQAIIQAVEVANSPETAEYLLHRFEENQTPDTLKAAQEVVAMLKVNVRNKEEIARTKLKEKENSLRGFVPEREVKFDEDIIVTARTLNAELANETLEEIKIDFAISSSSQLKRMYSSNDNPVNAKIEAYSDDMLHKFFEQNNLRIANTSEGSFIVTKEGGERAEPEQARNLMSREFPVFLEKQGVHSKIEAHHYQGEEPAPSRPEKEIPQAATPDHASTPVVSPSSVDEGPAAPSA